VATTRIVEDARFDAKLTKIDLPAEPIYPKWFFYYYCTHLRHEPQPAFLLDITGHEERKRQAILAYRSQFVVPERNRAIVDWIESAGRFFGSRIGVGSAEPFQTREPIGLRGLDSLSML
jgi:LmbE family N-acetylglucosaminyl deacetylase